MNIATQQPPIAEDINLRWRAPGLLGAALVFWGACVGWPVAGAVLALLVELPGVVRWRWALERRDLDRVADICVVLLLFLLAYQLSRTGPRGLFGVLALSPLALAPLVLVQGFAVRPWVSLASLFYSVRFTARPGEQVGLVDVRAPYFALCLLSAATLGATSVTGYGGAELARAAYLPGTLALLLLALFSHRPHGARKSAWGVAAAVVLASTLLGARGVVEARRAVEPLLMDFMAEYVRRWRDPFSGHITFGEIGALKHSERIVARVTPPLGLPPPRYLREASYQSFSRSVWLSRSRRYTEMPPEGDGERWTLYPRTSDERPRSVTIGLRMPRGRGLLPVPPGSERLGNLPVEAVFRTALDVLKVERGPELVEFEALYDSLRGTSVPGAMTPSLDDLVVPGNMEARIDAIAAELGLDGDAPARSAARLREWFNAHFEYSLDGFRGIREARELSAPLLTFLDVARRGHCELFATSTVLLLRSAGIPARYTVGYAVEEWSEIESAYVVRRRHAHAWAEMWDGTAWRVVDTTPPTWFAADAGDVNWWDYPRDWLSHLWYRFSRWRQLGDSGEWANALPWLVPPLLLLLAWRLARRRRTRAHEDEAGFAPEAMQGGDSAFFGVVAALERSGAPRRQRGETLPAWLARLAEDPRHRVRVEAASLLLPGHQRLRFDPRTVERCEQDALWRACTEWLSRHA